jgi:hypothetical protein
MFCLHRLLFINTKRIRECFVCRKEKWLSLELNPNLKTSSSGDNGASGADVKKSAHVVGDGGASWLKRAFKRAEEQAARFDLFLYFQKKPTRRK